MTRDHLLVIDQGTTSTRAVVYDAGSRSVGQGQAEVLPTYPQSGWVEHDPDALLGSVGPQVTRALDESGVRADRIAAIGLTNQRETTIVWERATGKADRAGAGLAGSADGGGLRPAQGPAGVGRRADRPGHRPVLLRDQDRLDSRPCPRGPPPRRGRRAGRGDGRQLPGLAPDRRPAVRHRRHQCVPDAADGPQDPPLGRGPLRIIRRPARNIARDPPQLGRIRPDGGPATSSPTACRSWGSPATSRPR